MRSSVRGGLKPAGSFEPQLVIQELALPPGGEWSPCLPGWSVIHVSTGVGYWLHPRGNQVLETGAVLLLSDQSRGCIRASEMGQLRSRFFRVDPGKLLGLVSLADQSLMQDAAGDARFAARVFSPNTEFTDKFMRFGTGNRQNSFPTRVQLIQLFLDLLGDVFEQPPSEVTGAADAKERLKQTLNQMPLSDLAELSFSDLVSKTRCSPRHLSRLFTELVGMPFREKQTELRLTRACELLATTDSKVVDVALESGYDSTSLFNAVFKQRLGTSPAKWRSQVRSRKTASLSARRVGLAA